MNVDKHPLRYTPLTEEIEAILIRRAYEKRLDGYTLDTAVEIAELVTRRLIGDVYTPGAV